jgi:hypothetical protein
VLVPVVTLLEDELPRTELLRAGTGQTTSRPYAAVQFPGQPMLQDADALINAFFDQNDEKEGYEILELPLLVDLATSAGQAQADSTKPPTEGATLSISSQPLLRRWCLLERGIQGKDAIQNGRVRWRNQHHGSQERL